MKEILFVNRCLTGGGSEKAMSHIANYFVAQGIKTSMILLDEHPQTYYLDNRIELIKCYCPIKGNKIIWHLKRIWTIRRAIKKSKAKVIISFMWDINMNVILACLGLKRNVIISERNDPKHEKRRLLKFAMRYVLPCAAYSVFQTQMVQSYYPIKMQKKSCVIPNAVLKKEFERKNKEKIVVAVGRLTAQKNFKLLIDAFSNFVKIHDDFILKIYGKGPLENELKCYIHYLNLESKVLLCGYSENVIEEISNAMIYVSSSNHEGISNAMLEAMTIGLACICTDCPVGGASLVIKNMCNGILIPVGDTDALCNAMFLLAENQELNHMISVNAEKITDDFGIEVIGKKWMELADKFEA